MSDTFKMPACAYCEFCTYLEEDDIDDLLEYKEEGEIYTEKHECPRCDRLELRFFEKSPLKCNHCLGQGIIIPKN